jgi:alcohol dehydrogenase YqhD (iron-dependent ADH family)
MENNDKELKDFERTANKMLESLQEFLPNMEALKSLSKTKISESQQKVVDEFSEKAKGLDISELTKLKEVYEKKIKDGF